MYKGLDKAIQNKHMIYTLALTHSCTWGVTRHIMNV